jgi:hypothetical protein
MSGTTVSKPVVSVWNEGAPWPCWTAKCRTLEEAEGLAARYRDVIARNGWNKSVRVDQGRMP